MSEFPKLYTYFIMNTKTGSVKIGQSHNPKERLIRLRYTMTRNRELIGPNLELLGIAEDVLPLEKILHEIYKPYQIENEWFNIPEEIFYDFSDLARLKTRAEIIDFLTTKIKEPELSDSQNNDMKYKLLENVSLR